jgi:hypothetical protein
MVSDEIVQRHPAEFYGLWKVTHFMLQFASSTRHASSRWWLVVIWVLAIPGIRPVAHEHSEVASSLAEALQLERHLDAFEHSSPGGQEVAHVHWVISLDGSLPGPFPQGATVAGPILNGWDVDGKVANQDWMLELGGTDALGFTCLLVDWLTSLEKQFVGRNHRSADACRSQSLFCVARL